MKDYKDLTREQFSAIMRSIKLGRTLQIDHPEISELYREVYSLSKIVEELDIKLKYGFGDGVSSSSVRMALTGHNGDFDIESYEGLIPDKKERKKIGRVHNEKCGHELGSKMYKEGKGIYERTTEQVIKDSRKGGKIGGRRAHEKGVGVHAQTLEDYRKVGRESAISRGQKPWSDGEKKDAYSFSENPDYKKGSRVNIELITQVLNNKWHKGEEVRNSNSVMSAIYRYRKSLEAKVED